MGKYCKVNRQCSNVGTCLRHVENTGTSGRNPQNNATQSKHAEGMSLREQIQLDEEHAKLMRQIESLERQMNATKQPRRKRELFLEFHCSPVVIMLKIFRAIYHLV